MTEQRIRTSLVAGQTARARAAAVLGTSYITPGPPYHRLLMEEADRLRAEREYALAVVVAQTACEVATERAFSTLRAHRSIADLAEPIGGMFTSHSLTNDKLAAIYKRLSGDTALRSEPFWRAYKEHVKRRNGVVHSGEKVSAAEAASSLQAASALLDHLDAVLASL